MATRSTLLLAVLSLLLLSLLSTPIRSSFAASDDDDEDLTFLEESESGDAAADHHHDSDGDFSDHNDEEFDNYDDSEAPYDFNPQDEDEDEVAGFDEKDVVVLAERNFSSFVEENKHVLVEFYAPWCGHCKTLAPEFAAAATELKAENVMLAKVDATEENELAETYEVQGFPTLYFFVDGEHKPYPGQRTKEGIVTWIKKKTGPGLSNITSTEDAERILTSENKVILGFFDSLVGPDSEIFAAASKLDDDVSFYQTTNPNVAKMFHLEADVKRPALVLLKKEAEKVTNFDGKFEKSMIAEFVSANKIPLVTTFSKETAPLIFESAVKKQLLLFATSNDTTILSTFQEAAKLFKGKIIFVNVEVDDDEVGKPVADYFGVTGNAPKVVGYAVSDETKKYFLDGEVTLEKIKAFGEAFVEDKLKPFYKSDPIPETNDGDVKIVVGDNFEDIVLDESKDVLLEIYAPWCGHCQSLEPTYNKLAKHLRPIESLVIAKMDGTTNEHPRAKADGFPTILFFPAGNKSVDPVPAGTERTVVAFYKFIKKHASIPFKLQKPGGSATETGASHAEQDTQAFVGDEKDEL